MDQGDSPELRPYVRVLVIFLLGLMSGLAIKDLFQ